VKLGWFVPTRSRPHNAVEVARAVRDTFNPRVTTLIFVIDHDDPQGLVYHNELYRVAPWAEVVTAPPRSVRRLGPVLNWAVREFQGEFDFIGFGGDDHQPRTGLWDEKLCWSLGGRPGVAYGDDLLQRQNLPTACVIPAEVVRVLGYMCPPPLVHLYLDDFWKTLGLSLGNLAYSGDVIIEHVHPAAGKARMDAVYAESGMNAGLYRDDKKRWDDWREHVWPGEVERLERMLGQP
jgi:hypothetical protein